MARSRDVITHKLFQLQSMQLQSILSLILNQTCLPSSKVIVDSVNIYPGQKPDSLTEHQENFLQWTMVLKIFWYFLGGSIYWPLTEAKYKAVRTKRSEQLYYFLLLPVSFGPPEVVVSLILVSEDLKSLPSDFAILCKLLGREHMWVEKMFLRGHGRAGLAVSLSTTDFSAVLYFCAAKGRQRIFPQFKKLC